MSKKVLILIADGTKEMKLLEGTSANVQSECKALIEDHNRMTWRNSEAERVTLRVHLRWGFVSMGVSSEISPSCFFFLLSEGLKRKYEQDDHAGYIGGGCQEAHT
ncbi:hypothetical protein OG21DRAFT_1507284 [Imleria badia]|nr:hypothetical protein OG21DRAFT_1507284 [Imleria badia]